MAMTTDTAMPTQEINHDSQSEVTPVKSVERLRQGKKYNRTGAAIKGALVGAMGFAAVTGLGPIVLPLIGKALSSGAGGALAQAGSAATGGSMPFSNLLPS